MGGVKDKNKIMGLFKTNIIKNCSKPTCQQCVWGSKETNKIKNKKQSEEEIEDRINGDIKNLFKEKEDYCKPVKVGNLAAIISNMKVIPTEMKLY